MFVATPNHRMLVERNGNLIEELSQHVKHGDKFVDRVEWQR
jgi:intein/homing endonuclease